MADENGVVLNAETAKRMLDNVSANDPSRWAATVQTLIIGLAARADELQRQVAVLARGAFALAKELREMRGGAPPAEPAPGTPPEPAPTPVPAPEGPGDGQRTPEQRALEAQMDQAIAASGLPSAAAVPTPARARAGRRTRPNGPELESLPQDPDARQTALNAIMDDAPIDPQ